MSAAPDFEIDHCPGFCNCCGLDLAGQQAELISRRQVVDIPVVRPTYTEHRIFRKSCLCGHINNGAFPRGVDAPISYGKRTTALIAYLHARQYIPLARTSEFFSSVYGMGISQGTVCGILERFAGKALPAFAPIKQAVAKAGVIGSDETGMNQNGKLNWFWAWQSKFATYITASNNRGFDTVKAHFPSGFPNAILVHDCWSSHLNTPAKGHQICTAHLLRELLFFKQKYQCPWAAQFSQMIIQAIELKKTMQPAHYLRPIKNRSDIEATLDGLVRQEINPGHPD
jgi:transposase